jgi:hypothetical protein
MNELRRGINSIGGFLTYFEAPEEIHAATLERRSRRPVDPIGNSSHSSPR